MKLLNFLIFISIVLLVYVSVNYYIFSRGLQAIPKDSKLRTYYTILFILTALTFWAGRILENFMLNWFTETLVWIGSFWLAFILYYFLFAALFDLLRLLNHFIGIFPSVIVQNYEKVKLFSLLGVIIIASITIVYGHINFLNPGIRKFEITLPKKDAKINSLNIAMASDIHLGTIVGKKQLDKFVEMANSLNPDIILLPGDIFDEDIGPIIKNNLGDDLKRLKAKYGVYAATGNHEYIGGVEVAVKYMQDHGINVIRDTAVFIDNSFYIVGREDRDITRFAEKNRKDLLEITKGLDKNYPIILLDHQPRELHEARENGIDLQLSGHTHHGQLWPLNYITSMIYEISWGYEKIGETHYYISSGFAGWGPPVRTGSNTELVNIIVRFE
ncbi:MAG: metallophosphoesterase [Melioribacteraceae bacterium]|nr:metallophosphoesterase [Melioribacteraceae bacterium]